MDASILVLCANRHFTGVTVTFYRCFGRFTGFRDGQGDLEKISKCQVCPIKTQIHQNELYAFNIKKAKVHNIM